MELLRLSVLLMVVALLPGCAAVVVGAAGTALAVAEDSRSAGTVVDDKAIELKIGSRIADKRDRHLNVTVFNRMVLLTGEVADAADKMEIEKHARSVENVRGVYNEIVLGDPSALTARTNDTFLTGLVKTRFVDYQKFNPLHVKVVTEASAVYLLGLVKRKEADDAVQIARTTRGVKKVIKLFEYSD